MHRLIPELTRLYLAGAHLTPALLEQRVQGPSVPPLALTTVGDTTRAIVIAFDKLPGSSGEAHWNRLCEVANALQTQLGLPAPAVSITGAAGYCLWLSLQSAAPVSVVEQFIALLRQAYDPEYAQAPALQAETAAAPELPPCLHPASGKWAAFIYPDLGASFADDPGLEMAPPYAGQAALLEGLDSISDARFRQALDILAPARHAPARMSPPPVPTPSPAAIDNLLLRDASLEDIVRYLHSKNIEPTFRHLLAAPHGQG